MIEHGGPTIAQTWITEMVASPTFDQPGKTQKSRLTFNLKGQILMTTQVADHEKLMAAIEGGDDTIKQVSPTEMPTTILNMPGYLMDINLLLAEQMRAAGGRHLVNKAPRGNMARKLGGGKGKGRQK
eukprot:6867978-Pyramimonas_sp.AAC.1